MIQIKFRPHLQVYLWHCQALLVLMTVSIAAFRVLPLLSATGWQRVFEFQIQSQVADLEHFVAELLEEFEWMNLYYWVQPLYMTGKLYVPGEYNAKTLTQIKLGRQTTGILITVPSTIAY